MLRAEITVDLPSSETNRSKGPIEWVRSLFGARIDLRSGKEELTIGAFALVEGLVAAFAKAGIHDAVSFVVDQKVVYMDPHDVPDDLPLIVRAAELSGVLNKPFREMHIVLGHKTEWLHTIIDCTITNQVMLGAAELTMVLSSRMRKLQIVAGESAQQYADRVRAFAAQQDSYQPYLQNLDQRTGQLVQALQVAFASSKVSHEPATVQLVRPSGAQVGKFRRLQFGSNVVAPSYRAVPARRRTNRNDDDPFYYYYDDPYYDFATYVVLDSMLHDHTWHSPDVQVCDDSGAELCRGDSMPAEAEAVNHGWLGSDAVCYGDDGELAVSDDWPDSNDSSDDSDASSDSDSSNDSSSESSSDSSSDSSCDSSSD